MSEKNISENKGVQSLTGFEQIIQQNPKVNSYYEQQISFWKDNLNHELNTVFTDDDKLAILDAYRKKFSQEINSFEHRFVYMFGDTQFNKSIQELTTDDFIDKFPMVAQINNLDTLTQIYPSLEKDNGLQQILGTLKGVLDKPVTKENDHLLSEAINQLKLSESSSVNFAKEIIGFDYIAEKDENLNTRRASEFLKRYYGREFFHHVCKMYDELKYKMENGNTQSMNQSNIKWKGDKIELIKVLVALNELGYFETKDGDKATTKKVMEEFSEFLGLDLTQYSSSLNRHLKGSEQNIFGTFKKMGKVIQEKREK